MTKPHSPPASPVRAPPRCDACTLESVPSVCVCDRCKHPVCRDHAPENTDDEGCGFCAGCELWDVQETGPVDPAVCPNQHEHALRQQALDEYEKERAEKLREARRLANIVCHIHLPGVFVHSSEPGTLSRLRSRTRIEFANAASSWRALELHGRLPSGIGLPSSERADGSSAAAAVVSLNPSFDLVTLCVYYERK